MRVEMLLRFKMNNTNHWYDMLLGCEIYMYLRCWSLSRSENYKTEMHSNKVSACKLRLYPRYHEMLLRCEMILRREIVLRCIKYTGSSPLRCCASLLGSNKLRWSWDVKLFKIPPPHTKFLSKFIHSGSQVVIILSEVLYSSIYRVQAYWDLKVPPEEEPV